MEYTISGLIALVLFLMGVLSVLLIHFARRDLTDGHFKKLLTWMFLTVLVSGLPYTILNFLIETKIVIGFDSEFYKIVTSAMFLLFFGFILKTAIIAKDLGQAVSFKGETDSIDEEIKKLKKSKN